MVIGLGHYLFVAAVLFTLGILGTAVDLGRDVLRPRGAARAVGEDDGADHGDEQHEPGVLEDVETMGVEHRP